MPTPVSNFAKVTVSTGYNATATSIVLLTGHGSRLPSTVPYPLVWWNASDYSDPADDPNREIVMVTARSGDTLTVTRGAEGTTATAKNLAGKTYKMILSMTAGMWAEVHERGLSESFRGLVVMNHPSADQKLSKVLFRADAIVMDDGEEIANWHNIVVDLAASGVNGLDTGSKAASTAYELYAISNGTTKAGLLHRAKNYRADTLYVVGDDGHHALRDATARTKLAQGFQLATAGLVEFVDVKLAKTGSPTGNYWFTIESSAGGAPSGTVLATSDKYDVSLLSGASTWVRLPFRTPASLSAATPYHLVLQADYTISASNYIFWRADTTAATYAGGMKAAYDGTTWTNDPDDDFMFQVWVTENDTPVVLPSGYTKKALICPFVYNHSDSHLRLFMQLDRSIYCFARTVNATSASDQWTIFPAGAGSAVPTLYHLGALVPPRPCTAHIAFAATGAAVSAQFGHLTATWIGWASGPSLYTSGPGAMPGSYTPSNTYDGFTYSVRLVVPIEYQGLMGTAGVSSAFARINQIDW
jgi:hypothetical protein